MHELPVTYMEIGESPPYTYLPDPESPHSLCLAYELADIHRTEPQRAVLAHFLRCCGYHNPYSPAHFLEHLHHLSRIILSTRETIRLY